MSAGRAGWAMARNSTQKGDSIITISPRAVKCDEVRRSGKSPPTGEAKDRAFPEPFGPSWPTISPGSIAKDTSLNGRRGSYHLLHQRDRSMITHTLRSDIRHLPVAWSLYYPHPPHSQ